MRTFGSQHFSTTILATVASVFAGSFAAAPLAAQQSAPVEPAPTARIIPARCSDAVCGGDYQLAIVAALYPYDDGSIRGPSVLTLVIENRGSTAAPLATLEAAPVAHFTNTGFTVPRRAPVSALLPGERTVVEIPLVLDANGGAPCLSLSVSPSIAPTRAPTQFYAAAAATPVAPAPIAPAERFAAASVPYVSFFDEGL